MSTEVKSRDRLTMASLYPEQGFWHQCWNLKERYGSLGGLDIHVVSIVRVDIPLLLNSPNIFAPKVISLVEFVNVLRINTPLF